ILRANINDLLNRAEDPEKMLAQVLREIGEAMEETKGQTAEAMAYAKLSLDDLEQARELSAQWQRKAQLAVDKGASDLARECLRRKRDYDANIRVSEGQVEAQQVAIKRLRNDLKLLEA